MLSNKEKETISQALEYTKDFFKLDSSGHDYCHTQRVYDLAVKIAKKEKANEYIVSLAALLHDVDDHKISPQTSLNKDNAIRFMAIHRVNDEDIKKIVQIIDEISFKGKDSVAPITLEGKCVQDADRLDAIGAIGIARCFSFGGSHNRIMYDSSIKPTMEMSEKEYYNHVSTTINHFYEKLLLLKDMMNTDTAKKIAKKRHQFMEEYLKEFFKEINIKN